MKIQYLLVLLPLYFQSLVFAQTHKSIIVKVGTTVRESVPNVDLYDYAQFTQGTVFFKNGKTAGAALNYNRYLDEMQFITPKGDTLTLQNETKIAYISIVQDTFFYDQGYVKLVNNTANLKVAIKKRLRVLGKQKLGAYGIVSSTEAITSYGTFSDGSTNYDLKVMQELILERQVQYYLGDDNNHFVIPSKKSLIKLSPNHQEEIKAYLKENSLVTDDETKMDKLIQFLLQLS
jgi:hypothetical protein